MPVVAIDVKLYRQIVETSRQIGLTLHHRQIIAVLQRQISQPIRQIGLTNVVVVTGRSLTFGHLV